LDVEARRGFWQVIHSLREAGTSIVLTTHYLEEADALAERVVLIERGRVLAEGTPASLKARARGARIRCVTRLSAAEVAALADVQSVEPEGSRMSILCSDSDALLRRLLNLDPTLSGIEIRPLNLEDAFLALTGDAA
jgi:ABC-2 type transport system ATP-binding protein